MSVDGTAYCYVQFRPPGKYTAAGLAREGARVVIVGRNVNTCIAAVSEIIKMTGNSNVRTGQIDYRYYKFI